MSFVTTEIQDAVAVLTIDRPKALNALNPEVLADLKAAFEAIDQNAVRCVVLTGAGDKSFVAGADIGSMSTMTKAEGEAFGKLGNDVFLMIESFPLPVIAAVNGFALGGGNELAMSCDIRLCSDNAVFGQPEVGLGITPGFGGTQRLARLVGMGMAKQLVYSALNIKADEALRIGLVNAVYTQEELMPAALKLAGKIAAELNIDLSDYEIINEPDKVQASLKAVKLAHDGVANMYMKGLLDTKTFLKSVLDKEVGLRTGNTLSHVAVFEVKGIEQLLFLTDVAFMTYPTLEDKVHIIENTVAVAHACGVECPKVAPLAAVEVVNPKMPCTVDADELRKMNAEGKITGCVVDGPLSMDIAIDPEAAHHKGAQDRPAAGHADILLFPDIQAGNLVYKTLVHTADCKNGCILTGTKVPAILTSRSDSFQTKVNSIALAAVVAAGLDQ